MSEMRRICRTQSISEASWKNWGKSSGPEGTCSLAIKSSAPWRFSTRPLLLEEREPEKNDDEEEMASSHLPRANVTAAQGFCPI